MPGLDPLFLTLAEDSSQATKYLMSLSTKKSLRPQTPSILNSALSSQGADPFQPVGNRAAWKQQRLQGEASIVLSQLVAPEGHHCSQPPPSLIVIIPMG